MRVIPFSDDYSQAWDNFVRENPDSTVYHYSMWLNLFRDIFGYKQKGFILIKNNDILGGIPLFEIKSFKQKRLVSIPFRDRGGMLIKDKVDFSFLFDKMAQLLKEGDYQHLTIKQGDSSMDELFMKEGFKQSSLWQTTTVDLTKGQSFLWNQLKNNAKGPIEQARKYDVRVYAGESYEDMDTFYNIFFQTRKALGIPTFGRSFFKKIWYTMCLTQKAKLFLAKKGDLTLAGVILLFHKNIVIEGYAASFSKHRHLRANDLLIWESLKWSIEQGYSSFDFGADSREQKGLLAFKRKFNGVHKTLKHYFLLNKCKKINEMDSSSKKYYFIRRILSKLPSPLFSQISNRIVSYFG